MIGHVILFKLWSDENRKVSSKKADIDITTISKLLDEWQSTLHYFQEQKASCHPQITNKYDGS